MEAGPQKVASNSAVPAALFSQDVMADAVFLTREAQLQQYYLG